ncbi:MAG: hypothetical protein LBG78_04670 [Azoarcus sp.]|nr:hypothetical protein [Azoarcus sp.]
MQGLGHYSQTVSELEHEFSLYCRLADIDWSDAAQVRALADDALRCTTQQQLAMLHASDEHTRARAKLFTLMVLMVDIFNQSMGHGTQVEGSRIWQAIICALTQN